MESLFAGEDEDDEDAEDDAEDDAEEDADEDAAVVEGHGNGEIVPTDGPRLFGGASGGVIGNCNGADVGGDGDAAGLNGEIDDERRLIESDGERPPFGSGDGNGDCMGDGDDDESIVVEGEGIAGDRIADCCGSSVSIGRPPAALPPMLSSIIAVP